VTTGGSSPDAILDGLRIDFVAGTLGQGGSERQLVYILRTLRECGAEPRVLSLTQGEHWEPDIRRHGIEVVWAGRSPGRVGRLLALTRLVGRRRPDLLQSFHFYTNAYTALAGRLLRIPDLGAIRSTGAYDLASVGVAMGRLCLSAPRALLANSAAALARLRALGVRPDRLHLLPNVIDTEWFAPTPAGKGAAFHIVAIGRLGPEKRYDRMLRVVAAMRRRVPRSIHLTVVGAGPLESALRRDARDLGLADHVTFSGPLPDVRPALAEADCLLLTSDAEGAPNVVLEAMAMARPVVAAGVGGVVELVAHEGTGLVVPADDESAYVAALGRVAAEPAWAAALGAAGRRLVEGRHALSGLGARLGALYSAILGR
jgi:glycosyltransferase involved in cell wall biosynthesis